MIPSDKGSRRGGASIDHVLQNKNAPMGAFFLGAIYKKRRVCYNGLIKEKAVQQQVEAKEKTLYEQAYLTIEEIACKAGLKQGSILVIGCSTSEIVGSKIGTNSAPEVAAEVFGAFYDYAKEHGIYLAVQCCEHLNRAIVTERAAATGLEAVNVVPQPKAGGSMATKAYAAFKDPVVVEEIKADAGIDIGLTLIGMHLKKVAVPVRLEHNRIGDALVIAARTRPKFIGGARAVYDETML